MNQDQTIIAFGDALSRFRVLSHSESQALEHAIRREQARHSTRRPWTHDEDAILADAAVRPLTGDLAACLAERLSRTTWAVNTRVRDLRKAQRVGPLLRKREKQRGRG